MSEVIHIQKTANEQDDTYPMPWRSTATCFNFYGGRVGIKSVIWYSDDLESRVKKLNRAECLKVKCLIVKADNITDFSFVSRFENLEQLYIYHSKITDLSFIESLTSLSQICLFNVHTEDLSPLVGLLHKKHSIYEKANNSTENEKPNGFTVWMDVRIQGIFLEGELNKEALPQVEMLYDPDICKSEIIAFGKRIC